MGRVEGPQGSKCCHPAWEAEAHRVASRGCSHIRWRRTRSPSREELPTSGTRGRRGWPQRAMRGANTPPSSSSSRRRVRSPCVEDDTASHGMRSLERALGAGCFGLLDVAESAEVLLHLVGLGVGDLALVAHAGDAGAGARRLRGLALHQRRVRSRRSRGARDRSASRRSAHRAPRPASVPCRSAQGVCSNGFTFGPTATIVPSIRWSPLTQSASSIADFAWVSE